MKKSTIVGIVVGVLGVTSIAVFLNWLTKDPYKELTKTFAEEDEACEI